MERRDDPGSDRPAQAIGIADRQHPVADPGAGRIAPIDVGQVLTFDLQQREIGGDISADDAGGIFLAVAEDDGDAVDRARAALALDEMVVGDDIAVGRNDKARTERAGFAGLRRTAAPGASATTRRALALRRLATEAAEEFGEGIGLVLHRHPLFGRNVDHRRLETRSKVGEAERRTGARGHRRRAVLRDLRSGLAGGQRESGSAKQQGGGDTIGVAHGSILLQLDHLDLYLGLACAFHERRDARPGV